MLLPHSAAELIRYIETSGESDNIDVKGPMKWDGGPSSAGLAKDIVAFANSRDGGVLVVGKKESRPGKFDLLGLVEEQADSFETTKLANWINSRFSPPVCLVCHRQDREGRPFVVITVSEFDDIPIMCTKSFHDPKDSRKLILRERTIYIRNVNAESTPLGSVEELRALIGLATAKRGDQMLAMFNAMLKGRPLRAAPSDQSQFDKELKTLVEADSKAEWELGSWRMSFHPARHDPARWKEIDDLESLIRKHSVRIRHEFPACNRGTHPREWGICNDFYSDIWSLTRSGLFVYQDVFRENYETYKHPWIPTRRDPYPDIGPGKWIEFQWNLYSIIEFFFGSSRSSVRRDAGVHPTRTRLVLWSA